MVWNRIKALWATTEDRDSRIDAPEYNYLQSTTEFTKSELQTLFKRFCKISNSIKGKLEVRTFLLQPEMRHCGLAALVVQQEIAHQNKRLRIRAEEAATSTLTDENAPHPVSELASNMMDFTVFVMVLNFFSIKRVRIENIESLFSLIARDTSPTVDKAKFKAALSAISHGNMSERTLNDIVSKIPDNVDVHRIRSVIVDHDISTVLCAPFI